jgi:hypothetical protein
MKPRCSFLFSVTFITAALLGAPVAGQNPYVPPYYPGYPGYGLGPVGGAYYGQAALASATGELMVQTEQARIEREKSIQEKLVTKKKSFEEMMYEKANTPTLTENLQYETGLITQRLITSPMPKEITNGETLNAMLPMIVKLSSRGSLIPPTPLDQDMLRRVNVTVGKGGNNFGVLKNGGSDLIWPFCLRGAPQKKVAGEITTAVSLAKTGNLEPDLYRQINSDLDKMYEDLRRKFHKEEIDGGEFIEAQRFLDPLRAAVKSLRDPTSQRFLDGTYTAQGRTVPELCYNMTQKGLMFTACNPGDENVYNAMHSMFAAYTTSAQSAAGFHVQYAPPRSAPWQVSIPKQTGSQQ